VAQVVVVEDLQFLLLVEQELQAKVELVAMRKLAPPLAVVVVLARLVEMLLVWPPVMVVMALVQVLQEVL
jgi:hypothetical protein